METLDGAVDHQVTLLMGFNSVVKIQSQVTCNYIILCISVLVQGEGADGKRSYVRDQHNLRQSEPRGILDCLRVDMADSILLHGHQTGNRISMKRLMIIRPSALVIPCAAARSLSLIMLKSIRPACLLSREDESPTGSVEGFS